MKKKAKKKKNNRGGRIDADNMGPVMEKLILNVFENIIKGDKKKTKWTGSKPKACDICGKRLTKFFVVARAKNGPKGILCEKCHEKHGCGWGVGKGEKYSMATMERVQGGMLHFDLRTRDGFIESLRYRLSEFRMKKAGNVISMKSARQMKFDHLFDSYENFIGDCTSEDGLRAMIWEVIDEDEQGGGAA